MDILQIRRFFLFWSGVGVTWRLADATAAREHDNTNRCCYLA